MEALSEFLAPSPKGEKPKKGIWLVEIRDAKTRQSLVVEQDEPVSAYVFPDPEAALFIGGTRLAGQKVSGMPRAC